MLNLTLKFVACCRAADLRVSTSEVLDTMSHLKLINPVDEEEFKTTLRANFAKSRRDQSKFDHLYNLFFHDVNIEEDAGDLKNQSEHLSELIDRLRDEMDPDGIDNAIIDFLDGDPLEFVRQLQLIHVKQDNQQTVLRSNMGQLSERLNMMLQINRNREKALRFLGENWSDMDKDTQKTLERRVNDIFNTATALINQEPRPHNEALRNVKNHEKHYKYLGEQPFSSLTPQEVDEVRVVVNELVRKMKDIVNRRYNVKNRGVLDVKKTLRKANKYQGTPIEIVFKDKPLRKGKIVTLCDISGSVWSTARFMLNVLYSLQDCFSRVKSYIFVSDLADVTEFFDHFEINDAINKILSEANINYNAPTDYGETFIQFKEDYLYTLDKKTTLIIIGDARSNYMNPQEHILNEMRMRCKRVIWLNPEEEKFWGTGDSEMNTYKPRCHEVRTCNNLNQMIDFIEDLIL